jgi:flagellar hook assembly protein FlgD
VQPAGHKVSDWDGRDESGATVAAGIYLVRLKTGSHEFRGTILRLR